MCIIQQTVEALGCCRLNAVMAEPALVVVFLHCSLANTFLDNALLVRHKAKYTLANGFSV